MLIDGFTIAKALDSGTWNAYRKDQMIAAKDLKIGTNSVDLTLGDHMLWMEPPARGVDPYDPKSVAWSKVTPTLDGVYYIMPNILYLGYVAERFDCKRPVMTNFGPSYVVPMLDGRSTMARLGVSVHETAGFGDYGFDGNFTLEICSTYGIKLYVGMRIAQISFQCVTSSVDQLVYKGAYDTNHRDRPVPPVLGRNRFE
jgi:deoxycytidine triphosphate deaminase